jgi:HK97 family phage portal protein
MAFWNRKKAEPEQRATVEDPTVPISSAHILDFLGASGGASAAGINVTIDKAMGVPAIWAAVNFISGTMAGLPLNLYQKTEGGRVKVDSPLARILHDSWNDETSSFDARKYSYEQVFTGGRSITFIESNAAGRVINLWPLNPETVKIEMRGGRKVYRYKEQGRKEIVYVAGEIIDIPFSLRPDMMTSRSPILTNADTIGLGIAATNYGSKLFQNGGVPPFMITGNFESGAALKRASDDLQSAIRAASKENRLALSLPTGHEIKSIGIDPEKSQLVELKRFLIEEYARIYSLPPTFLQDLSNGTFSNTEQQDLHFVKHTIKRWVEQTEQEMNLKLFGKLNNEFYVEFNLDGLLRGDFKTRMDGYASGIQNAVLTPNEARRQENRPDMDEGNKLMIQGATVPLGSQPITPPATEGTSNEA